MRESRIHLDAVTQQRLSTDASARELAPLLTADERIVVGMLAAAEVYDLNLTAMISSFASETSNVYAERFCLQFSPEVDAIDVAQSSRLLSEPSMTALQSARANGSLSSFYRSWLAQTVEDRVNRARHEDTHIAAFTRLGVRALFCGTLIAFITSAVIPEFQKMNEEFGVASTGPMELLLEASGVAFTVFLFLMATITLLCLYTVIFKRTVIKNYFQRWLPGRWQQVILPKSILRRKLMAWDLQGLQQCDGGDSKELSWDFYVSKKLLTSNEAKIMQSASSLESQSWLLRNMTENRLQNRNDRFEVLVRFIIMTFQIVIAAFIVLAALAIFSNLLGIMRSIN